MSRILIYGVLMLGTLPAAQSRAEDRRTEAVEALLLTKWNLLPEDLVVEIVLDPVIGQAQRHRVLRVFLDRQKTVARHREYVQQCYLPRLERMFREMPAEDLRSLRLILQGMAALQQERDRNDAKMREFLHQQLAAANLSPGRREACQAMLSEILGQVSSSASDTWRAEERQIAGMLARGAAGDAYRLSLSVLSDGKRPVDDRVRALRCLDELLGYPTGVAFEQIRRELAKVCATVQEPALAGPLVGSIARSAFLEQMDPEHVLAVLKTLAQQEPNAVVRSAVDAVLTEVQASRGQWTFDHKEHMQQADALVRQANLGAEAQQQYLQLVGNPDYYARPVGQAQRWWFLGKFLWRHQATKAAVEALGRYLETREPCTRVDDYLREAVKILAAARPAMQQEPYLYWASLARLPKSGAARAFVSALADELSGSGEKAALAQFAVHVLQQDIRPELAQAVLENVLLSSGQAAPLASATPAGEAGRYCRTAVAAALAREGKAAEAAGYLDLRLTDPLPGVPLFRATGVADVLFAGGRAGDADRLVRSLLLRPGAAAQRTNLLVYLLDQQLQAGNTEAVLRIQEELSDCCSVEPPATMVAALSKCIGLARDKDPEVRIALMRLSCEILNGDTYPRAMDSSLPAEHAIGFWRSTLAWSQDNAKTEGLEQFIQRQPTCPEADLARVLLARQALDLCQADRAANLLQAIEDSSPLSLLAAEQRRRLQALRDRNAALASIVQEQAAALTSVAEQSGMVQPAVEAHLLLAEFGGDALVRVHALSRAVELCGQSSLCHAYKGALRTLLDAVRSECEDAEARSQCVWLAQQVAELPGPESQPVARATAGRLGPPLDSTYADAMGRIGVALRSAGQYRRAAEVLHRSWQIAPLAKGAAHFLKEEVMTLRFYLVALEESEVRLRQLMAIYPHGLPGEWARSYLGSLANPEHPE